jgi:hypothetical protein
MVNWASATPSLCAIAAELVDASARSNEAGRAKLGIKIKASVTVNG